MIKKGDKLINTVIAPVQDGHSVYFDLGTSIAFELNLPNVNLGVLSIGSQSTVARFVISGTQVVTNSLFVHPMSTVSCINNAKVKILSKSSIGGSSLWYGCTLQGNWTIPVGSTFSVTGGVLDTATFEVFGVLNLVKGSTIGSTIIVRPGGVLLHNDSFEFDPSSTIQNSGNFEVSTQLSPSISSTLINSGTFRVYGTGKLKLGSFSQTLSGTLVLSRSTIESSLPISIAAGRVDLKGVITTPLFNYSSTDEVFRIGSELVVIGNMTLSESATVLLNIYRYCWLFVIFSR